MSRCPVSNSTPKYLNTSSIIRLTIHKCFKIPACRICDIYNLIMAKPIKEEKCYSKWIQLIKAGKIKEVRIEVESEILGGKNELECIVAISQLAYSDSKKGVKFDSSPSDVLCLTHSLCSSIDLQPSKNALRFFTSLYHIIHFFYDKDHLEHVISLFKTVIQFKKREPWAYEDEGKTLHEAFIRILKNTLGKLVSTEDIKLTTVIHLLSILLELSVHNQGLSNGEMLYLQILLSVCQIADKHDKKAAVRLITNGLGLFYKVEKVRNAESCLLELFKIYTCLYIFQIQKRNLRIALETVDSHLNEIKWKFKDNLIYGECFVLLCSAVKLFLWNSEESSLQKKVEDNISILKSFQISSKNNPVIIAACSFMVLLLVNSLKAKKQNTPALPQTCLEPFLLMVFSLFSLLKDSGIEKTDLIQCLSNIFMIVSYADPPYAVNSLRKCVSIIAETQKHMFQLLHNLRSTGHKQAETFTKLLLVYSANVIRSYHVASLPEEVKLIAQPVCKFICSLPSTVFEEPQNQHTADVCFTCLVSAFDTKHLDMRLKTIVAWVSKCPQSSQRALRMWGDSKHNTVCEGSSKHLNKTVWTILSEERASLESEWFQCELTNAQIADLLVLELKTYFVNKTLRGQPAMEAGEALLALPGVDCLSLVRGLTIALDIASASPDHHKHCVAFYNKSKSLLTKFRNQKKNINPVDFNCCMGDLLYAQLRCKLRFQRMECESEVVRLSVTQQPLVEELPENKPDPNDTCNVHTKYHYLSLAEHRNLTDQVLVAHRHWALAYSLFKVKEDVEEYDLTVTLESLQGAGFLLKLYCDEVKQTKMWQLLYKVAKVAENVNMMVTAMGELLNLSENIEQEFLENAEEQLKNPQLLDKVKHGFILNLSLHNLNNRKIAEGLELLKGVETDIRKSNVCFTLFLIMMGKYQKLPDWEKYQLVFSNSPSYHFSFHKAISYLLYLIEEKKWGSFTEACQIQWQLLHVSNLLGEANSLLEQPRRARCYLKTPLSLAQKLALPLRTLQLLLQLAWVDLSSGLWEDCGVKLEGLEDLLELCGTPVMYNSQLTSSPIYKSSVSTLVEPDFLGHTPGCCCLPCTTPEYRRLVLETITLRATLCAAIGKINDALQYFKLGMRVLKDLTECKDDCVRHSCTRLWLRYADALTSTHKYGEALTANSQALELLSAGQDPNIIQYAQEQKFALQHFLFQYHHSPISVKVVLKANNKTPTKCNTPPSMKTPLILPGKSPLTVVNDNVILPPITPFACPVRPFKLFSSGEENTPPKSTSKSKKQTKIPKFVKETSRTTAAHKSTKSSSTPFVIVDDDGNAVGVSGKKSKVKTTAKPDSASHPNKSLFSSHGLNSDLKSELASSIGETDDIIVRKASRVNPGRVYGKAKSVHKKDTNLHVAPKESKQKETKKEEDDDDVFVLDKMKKVIHSIEDSVVQKTLPKNSNSDKISSTFKQASKSLCTINSKAIDAVDKKNNIKNESDCDIVEGTPPEPTKTFLRPRRAVRSNKL